MSLRPKKDLSAAVVRATTSCRAGTVVDLFAGMGSVAAAHDAKRQIWANDIQHFAFLNNKCRLTQERTVLSNILTTKSEEPFMANVSSLWGQAPSAKRSADSAESASDLTSFSRAISDARQKSRNYKNAYCCFSNRYVFTYFSLNQCIEIDSIRCLLETLRGHGEIDQANFDWGLLCLGAAALRCANTTGHFAQYMKPNEGNWRRVQRQFRKSIWNTWKSALAEIEPFGKSEWRAGNRVTRQDAVEALKEMDCGGVGVVYCDPPYTDDQYSRFYHLWETIVLYDYPEATGAGQYRSNRFTTEFSSVRRVAKAFDRLAERVASVGADFVLSYPSNGLLHEAGGDPLDVIKKHFSNAQLFEEIVHGHSSMGASKGSQKNQVFERIYVGRHG